jgi:hypothetical protein
LVNVHEHVKNYRPQILVLSGKPQDRPPLVDLAHIITKNSALMVCGHVSEVSPMLIIICLSIKVTLLRRDVDRFNHRLL